MSNLDEYDRYIQELNGLMERHEIPGPLFLRAKEYLTLGEFDKYKVLADLFPKFKLIPPEDMNS